MQLNQLDLHEYRLVVQLGTMSTRVQTNGWRDPGGARGAAVAVASSDGLGVSRLRLGWGSPVIVLPLVLSTAPLHGVAEFPIEDDQCAFPVISISLRYGCIMGVYTLIMQHTYVLNGLRAQRGDSARCCGLPRTRPVSPRSRPS